MSVCSTSNATGTSTTYSTSGNIFPRNGSDEPSLQSSRRSSVVTGQRSPPDFDDAIGILRESFDGELKRVQVFYEERMARDAAERETLMGGLMEENARLIHERTSLENENRKLQIRLEQLEALTTDKNSGHERSKFGSYHRPQEPGLIRLSSNSDNQVIQESQFAANDHSEGGNSPRSGPLYLYERERHRAASSSIRYSSNVPTMTENVPKSRTVRSGSFGNDSVASGQSFSAASLPFNQQHNHQQQPDHSYSPPHTPRRISVDSQRHSDLLAEIDRSLAGPSASPRSLPSKRNVSSLTPTQATMETPTQATMEAPPSQSPFYSHAQTAIRDTPLHDNHHRPQHERLPPRLASQALVRDGRNFFRDARAYLQQPAFEELLLGMKQLNLGQQTRAETLEACRTLFGSDGSELFNTFQDLLEGKVG